MTMPAASAIGSRPFHAVRRDEPSLAIDLGLCAVIAVAVVVLLVLAL